MIVFILHAVPSPHHTLTVVTSTLLAESDPGDPYVHVVLQWDDRQLDAVLNQTYTIAISPPTANFDTVFHTPNKSIQLALLYDQDYSISVMARSCFGNSTPAEISIRIIDSCNLIRNNSLVNYCLSSEINNNIMTTADEIMAPKSINDSTLDGGPQQYGIMCIHFL